MRGWPICKVVDLTGRWVNRFTLEKTSSGARIERGISAGLSGAQLLLFWLVLYPIKKPNARRSLVKLKDPVERAGSRRREAFRHRLIG